MLSVIRKYKTDFNYVLDPHSAVAYYGVENMPKDGTKIGVLCTGNLSSLIFTHYL